MDALATPQQAGHLLVAQRKTLGMSQAEVAKRLGISQSRYSELEAKPERITLARLMTLNHPGYGAGFFRLLKSAPIGLLAVCLSFGRRDYPSIPNAETPPWFCTA